MKVKVATVYVILLLSMTTVSAFAHGDAATSGWRAALLFGLSLGIGTVLALAGWLFRRQFALEELIVGLTTTTAVVHGILGLIYWDKLLVLNGIGFMGLLAIYYLPLTFLQPFRWMAHIGLIIMTVATIVAYFVTHGLWIDALAAATKAIEVALLGLLILGLQRKRTLSIA